MVLFIPIQFTGCGLWIRAGRQGLRAEPQVDGVRGLRHRDRPHLRPAGLHGRVPSGEALGGNCLAVFMILNLEDNARSI